MIQVIGQATQSDGGSPSWTLTGVCKSAARTGTGTYTVTLDYLEALGVDSKDKLTILISAERGNLGTERYILDWTSTNTFRVRNYTARNNQTLGDCMLTITILADVNPIRLWFSGNTLVFPKYKFFDVTTVGGFIEASNTAGYPGELNVLTGVPATDAYKCSGFGITGAALTGNEFKYKNMNVSAEALFEHSRDLTLINSEHGTLSADKMSGFSGDVVTVDATTDEGWYLSAIALTGAEATGFKFMFTGSDVTALGEYTDVGFPVTYLADEHVQCTGDTTIYIPGGTGITLETGYDPYYRISGYEVENGTVENGVLIPTGPCTVKAIETPNYFTATGGWEKGSNVNAVARGQYYEGDASIPDKYAIHGAHTGDIPTSWYSNSNRWNVNSEVSSYSITMNPIMGITAARSDNASNTNSMYTAYAYIGSTSTAGAAQDHLPMGLTKYNKTFTTNTTGVYYKINGHLHTWTYKGAVFSTAGYVASYTTGTWTATGIAP
jgi:hypothetical protein